MSIRNIAHNVNVLNLPNQVVLFLLGKEMDTVMMKTIMQDVNLMEEIVVEPMSTRNIAHNVNALKAVQVVEEEVQVVPFLHGKEMDTVMMKTIMQDVTLMEETVVEPMSIRNIAHNVNVLMAVQVVEEEVQHLDVRQSQHG